MIRRRLLRKELRQNGWTFASIAIAGVASAGLAIWHTGDSNQAITALEPFRVWLALFVPIAAAMLSRILIHQELRSGTHEYLLGLPLSAPMIFRVKTGLGMALLTLLAVSIGSVPWPGRSGSPQRAFCWRPRPRLRPQRISWRRAARDAPTRPSSSTR